VVPLVRASVMGKFGYPAFNPTFKVRGSAVVLHPLEMVSIPVAQLGAVVGSLAGGSEAIVAALDRLLSRALK
jgi:toxin CcdB